jgi:glycosyltransferase 2 family protein
MKGKNWIRLAGIVLLIVLFWQIDFTRTLALMKQVSLPVFAVAVLLNIPQIFLKAYRWQGLLRSQKIHYGIVPALLSYFGSIFIGLLTPGRLGELIKTIHVSQDCGVSKARALSSVLVDRLFDLYALLLVGDAALLSRSRSLNNILALVESAVLLVFPLVVLLHDGLFHWVERLISKMGKWGAKLFAPESWLIELRTAMRELPLGAAIVAGTLTFLAYAVFFEQCFLLAQALNVKASFFQISYAVALGSLVTLIPISISGLGTREATIVAYLGTAGVSSQLSLGYSLLVFVAFYVAGGLMGAAAWSMKPVAIGSIK